MTAPVGTRSSSPADTLPELVAAAVAGNRTAWDTLVQRFAPLITSVTRRFGLSPSDADDVRQTVWLRLVEHLADLREPRALPGWIATTARREALRILSGRRRVDVVDPQTDTRLDTVTTDEPDANLPAGERRHAVHASLAEPQAPHRDLLQLTVADTDNSYRQVSRRLGIPIGGIGPTVATPACRDSSANHPRWSLCLVHPSPILCRRALADGSSGPTRPGGLVRHHALPTEPRGNAATGSR